MNNYCQLNNSYEIQELHKKHHDPIEYGKICMAAILKEGYVLKYVDANIFINNVDIYVELCRESIKMKGYNLKYVDTKYIKDTKTYEILCRLAIRDESYTLQYVESNIFKDDLDAYKNICLEAVGSENYSLKYVNSEMFTSEPQIYAEICLVAISREGFFLKYVDSNIFDKNPDLYSNICLQVLKNNVDNLKYANIDKLEEIFYKTIKVKDYKNNHKKYIKCEDLKKYLTDKFPNITFSDEFTEGYTCRVSGNTYDVYHNKKIEEIEIGWFYNNTNYVMKTQQLFRFEIIETF